MPSGTRSTTIVTKLQTNNPTIAARTTYIVPFSSVGAMTSGVDRAEEAHQQPAVHGLVLGLDRRERGLALLFRGRLRRGRDRLRRTGAEVRELTGDLGGVV